MWIAIWYIGSQSAWDYYYIRFKSQDADRCRRFFWTWLWVFGSCRIIVQWVVRSWIWKRRQSDIRDTCQVWKLWLYSCANDWLLRHRFWYVCACGFSVAGRNPDQETHKNHEQFQLFTFCFERQAVWQISWAQAHRGVRNSEMGHVKMVPSIPGWISFNFGRPAPLLHQLGMGQQGKGTCLDSVTAAYCFDLWTDICCSEEKHI